MNTQEVKNKALEIMRYNHPTAMVKINDTKEPCDILIEDKSVNNDISEVVVKTNTPYILTTEDLEDLRNQIIKQEGIIAMLSSAERTCTQVTIQINTS